MIGFPFDSHVEFDKDGNIHYDRAITSEPYRKLLKELFTTGIMPTDSSCYQVTTGTDMNVIVQAGFAMVEGLMKLEEENRTIAVQASDSTYDRIDTVVLRLDDNDDMRICDLYVVQGIPSENPVRPELTREGSIYELGLADLFITKNATQILASKITDTRYDEERCGVVRSIAEYDTTFIYNQVQSDLHEFKTEEEAIFASWSTEQRAQFVAWFETIRGILDEDMAGHLQNEIDSIKVSLTDVGISLLESNWVAQDDGTYKQDINVEGLSGESAPIILLNSAGGIPNLDELATYNLLSAVTTADGVMTFIASAKPEHSISVVAKGVVADSNSAIAELATLTREVDKLSNDVAKIQQEGAMVALDYDNPIKTLTGGDTYTATETCYLVGTFLPENEVDCKVKIGNTVVCTATYSYNARIMTSADVYRKLTKGDVVVQTAGSGLSILKPKVLVD